MLMLMYSIYPRANLVTKSYDGCAMRFVFSKLQNCADFNDAPGVKLRFVDIAVGYGSLMKTAPFFLGVIVCDYLVAPGPSMTLQKIKTYFEQ